MVEEDKERATGGRVAGAGSVVGDAVLGEGVDDGAGSSAGRVGVAIGMADGTLVAGGVADTGWGAGVAVAGGAAS